MEGKEEGAIAVYHVTDGVEGCRVGFLKRHLVKHGKLYDGVLVQVTEVYSKESESATKRKMFIMIMVAPLHLIYRIRPTRRRDQRKRNNAIPLNV